jgi:hypothetical protein
MLVLHCCLLTTKWWYVFCMPPLSLAATNIKYILDGQHRYVASQRVRKEYEDRGQECPAWCRTFRCAVLYENVSREDRQLVAGGEQARQGLVFAQPLSAKAAWFLRELATWKSNHPEHTEKDLPHGVGTELLNRTYAKMGNTVLDGKKVRPSPFCLGVVGEPEV